MSVGIGLRRRVGRHRTGGGGGGGGPWSFSKTITIDHTKAGTANTTDFPLLFSSTVAALKTTANGGSVQSTSGYDIAFFSDSGLTTMLDFEVESWSATTGAIIAWVRVPTLSASVDTVIYLGYGNASITSSQQNVGGTWESNYLGVYHLGDGVTANGASMLADSSGNGNTMSGGGSSPAATGIVFGGLHMTTGSDRIGSTGSTLDAPSAFTIEGWYKPDNFSDYRTIAFRSIGNSTVNYYIDSAPSTGYPRTGFTQGFNNFKEMTGTSALSTSAMNYVVGTYDGTTLRLYLNGASTGTPVVYSVSPDTGGQLTIGAHGAGGDPYPGLGIIDEVRASGTARSASYVTATYNNISSPSTFYTVT